MLPDDGKIIATIWDDVIREITTEDYKSIDLEILNHGKAKEFFTKKISNLIDWIQFNSEEDKKRVINTLNWYSEDESYIEEIKQSEQNEKRIIELLEKLDNME